MNRKENALEFMDLTNNKRLEEWLSQIKFLLKNPVNWVSSSVVDKRSSSSGWVAPS